MKKIDYKDYLDKTLGCWMGKCISGTIGAPFEGAKELFDIQYESSMLEKMLPNDDLDLQVLWLWVLEQKGVLFTSDDLANAFFTKCPYAPGEYAVFKKNYSRGIHPPMTGWYNNRYYIQGMGCPIRSEIWACIAPGNPRLAAELSQKDGVLDHAGESVYAEQFLAAVESAAFFKNDLDKLIETGLGQIPDDSKFAGMVRKVQRWCKESDDWHFVRELIIRDYGHPDCTNMFQNMGFTVLALYYGEMDFMKTTMIALNCGFDTDCTCATAGALLGIIRGAEFLMRQYGVSDQGYVLGVNIERRSNSLTDLAEDTCLMGLHFAEHCNDEISFIYPPKYETLRLPEVEEVKISVDYQSIPAIGLGDSTEVFLAFDNTTDEVLNGTVSVSGPKGWDIYPGETELEISPNARTLWTCSIGVPEDLPVLDEKNLFTTTYVLKDGREFRFQFGLAGAAVWEVFGPFWENNVEMPDLKAGDSFYAHIPGGDNRDEMTDNVRTYHLNMRVNLDKEYMSYEELCNHGSPGEANKTGKMVNFYEDLMSTNDAFGFQGPCTLYMVRRLISPEDRIAHLLIGHTDAYRLWINGKKVSSRDTVDWWTAENAHVHDVQLSKGENIIVVQLFRRSAETKFSLIFTKGGTCTDHFDDFSSGNGLG